MVSSLWSNCGVKGALWEVVGTLPVFEAAAAAALNEGLKREDCKEAEPTKSDMVEIY
jgi:hypothetical protein